MRPSPMRLSAAEVLQLLHELPDDSALVAGLRATAEHREPTEPESEVVAEFRRRRRWRGWTRDRELIADARDCLVGKHSPRPWDDDQVSSGGRKVVDIIPI